MPKEFILELAYAKVRSADRKHVTKIEMSEDGIQPFMVERGWSGPAGSYSEQFSIRRGGDETLYESEPRLISIRGIQSTSRFTDLVKTPPPLEVGTYNLVFIVEGRYMGSEKVEVAAP